MGDINALTRHDYTDEYFKAMILEKRENFQWKKLRFDLAKLITNEWDYQDAFKLINPKLKDKQVATCRFGTRVDYIYVHPRVNDQWTLTKCQIIDTKRATDHHAVLAEFVQKSK